MKTEKIRLPPISPLVDYYSGNPGSLDFVEMNNQLPNKLTQSSAYDEINTLPELANALKLENDQLLQDLYAVSDDETNQSVKLEHRLITFLDRLKEREKELKNVTKFIHQSSKKAKSKSNFIEVEVARDRQQASFDLVATSLLASNEQRKFFKAPDIERQNKELVAMIRCQEEELRLIRARYNLYAKMQQNNSLPMKMNSLSKGQRPLKLADVAPDQRIEQDITINILQSELQSLIDQRKQLTGQQKARRNKIRMYRLRFRSAFLIQKYVRGFLVRRKAKTMKEAATMIQKVFRGYHSRHAQNILSKQNSLSKINNVDNKNNNNNNNENNNKENKIEISEKAPENAGNIDKSKSIEGKKTCHRSGVPSLPIPKNP